MREYYDPLGDRPAGQVGERMPLTMSPSIWGPKGPVIRAFLRHRRADLRQPPRKRAVWARLTLKPREHVPSELALGFAPKIDVRNPKPLHLAGLHLEPRRN